MGSRQTERVLLVLFATLLFVAPMAMGVTSTVVPGETKFTPSDGGRTFGISVAVSGDSVFVGAGFDDATARSSGSAYLYQSDGAGGWTETKFTASDGAAGDRFGQRVATSGERLLVGAPGDEDQGGDSGSAYLYQPDGAGSWTETKFTASDGTPVDGFGFSVAISGETLLVGASGDDNANGENAGAAYVYQPDGADGWTETKLTASDGAAFDDFGTSVAISGETLLVGATGDDDRGSGSGSAYLYQPDGAGGWTETKFIAGDGAEGDVFGYDVAIDGSTLLIGAPGDDDLGSKSGSAYLYQPADQGGWMETKFTASDGEPEERFGESVARSGGSLLVGASQDDDPGPLEFIRGRDRGSAYLYRPDGSGDWTETKLTASDSNVDAHFGRDVAMHGDAALIGAYGDDSAYLYEADCWRGVRTPITVPNGNCRPT